MRWVFLPPQPLILKSQQWSTNLVFKFHEDPTVNKFRIVILLEQVWVSAGKEKTMMRRTSLTKDIGLQITTVRMFANEMQNQCSNFTKIQWLTSLRSSFYWDMFGCMREKERVLGDEEVKTKLRGRKSVEIIVSLKTDLMRVSIYR